MWRLPHCYQIYLKDYEEEDYSAGLKSVPLLWEWNLFMWRLLVIRKIWVCPASAWVLWRHHPGGLPWRLKSSCWTDFVSMLIAETASAWDLNDLSQRGFLIHANYLVIEYSERWLLLVAKNYYDASNGSSGIKWRQSGSHNAKCNFYFEKMWPIYRWLSSSCFSLVQQNS